MACVQQNITNARYKRAIYIKQTSRRDRRRLLITRWSFLDLLLMNSGSPLSAESMQCTNQHISTSSVFAGFQLALTARMIYLRHHRLIAQLTFCCTIAQTSVGPPSSAYRTTACSRGDSFSVQAGQMPKTPKAQAQGRLHQYQCKDSRVNIQVCAALVSCSAVVYISGRRKPSSSCWLVPIIPFPFPHSFESVCHKTS